MTFIVAIQLNDSIVIAADNKHIIINEIGESRIDTEKTQKIYLWNKGIIVGTGESYVINRSVELFKKTNPSRLDKLPQCLEISRQLREFEIGTDYYQVENTKLLCSCYSESGIQLYTVQRFNPSQPYELTTINAMSITVWLFHPNVETISVDLQNLYSDLKDYSTFSNQIAWINYYIRHLAPIYRKQSQQDPLMSQSFDYFFQAKDEYITGHISNTSNTIPEIKEISSNYESI